MEWVAKFILPFLKPIREFVLDPYLEQERLARKTISLLDKYSPALTNVGFGANEVEVSLGNTIRRDLIQVKAEYGQFPKGIFYPLTSRICNAYPSRKKLKLVSDELHGLSNSVFNEPGVPAGLRIQENRKGLKLINSIIKFW